jgi:hypothetical protein
MLVGAEPTGKVVVAPICGCVVIVPGPMSESGIAVGLVEMNDHDTEGRELNEAEAVEAPEEATPGRPELTPLAMLADGADDAAAVEVAAETADETGDAGA